MSILQAHLIYRNDQHVFLDGTFYSAQKAAYKVITIIVKDIINKIFYTLAYGLLVATYIEFLAQIKITFLLIGKTKQRNMAYNDPTKFIVILRLLILGQKKIFIYRD